MGALLICIFSKLMVKKSLTHVGNFESDLIFCNEFGLGTCRKMPPSSMQGWDRYEIGDVKGNKGC